MEKDHRKKKTGIKMGVWLQADKIGFRIPTVFSGLSQESPEKKGIKNM
jgi:hypothetical protein